MKKSFFLLSFFLQTIVGFSQQANINQLDTLRSKRIFLWTNLYKGTDSVHLTHKDIKLLVSSTKQANKKYTYGKIIQPVGPVVALGGIALLIKGLTPKHKTAVIDGIAYNYGVRSLPKTLVGLGLVALGLCTIESSNELIQHSADIYNQSLKNRLKAKVGYKIGITPTGNIGLAMKF